MDYCLSEFVSGIYIRGLCNDLQTKKVG